jgi:hypothetical protein
LYIINISGKSKKLKKFQKPIAIFDKVVYNEYIKVVKSGANTVKSGAKGGENNALL